MLLSNDVPKQKFKPILLFNKFIYVQNSSVTHLYSKFKIKSINIKQIKKTI